MNTVKIKIGRNIFEIDDNDLILDNGSSYQLVTKEIRKGWDRFSPTISKSLFNKMKKLGYIGTNSQLKEMCENRYKYNIKSITYWQFNIFKMLENGVYEYNINKED